jgi:predicted NBD/HSP70 family sugar kinase
MCGRAAHCRGSQEREVIVGIDVREAAVAAVRIDDTGRVVGRSTQETATAAAAADAVRAISGNTPKRVGAAVRDPADHIAADIVAAAAGVARVTDAPRVVGTGAAVALAEQWRGAAQGAQYVVALTVSDFVSAGFVHDGRIFEGAHGLAGAASWLALNPVERDDYRRLGGLEAEVGADGIVRRLVWRLKAGDSSDVLDLAGGQPGAITVAHVFEAARGGDGVAIAVVRDTARYIGMAIGNLVAILDPEIVVLGGLIAEAADLLLEPSTAEAVRRLPPAAAATLRVVPGALGAEAAALGAARAAMIER